MEGRFSLAFAGCYACLMRRVLFSRSRCFLGARVCKDRSHLTYNHGSSFAVRAYESCGDMSPRLCQKDSTDMTRGASVTRPNTSLWESIKNAPRDPGVYMFRDESGNLLYVGKSKTLRNRVCSYFSHDTTRSTGTQPAAGLSKRIQLMTKQATSVEFIVTKSEAAALALEASLVREHVPPYNVLLKDDARYPCICITFSEKYPRILITRNRRQDFVKSKPQSKEQNTNSKDRLYGPFVDASALRRLLWAVKQAFPLRQRETPLHRDRPCINYEIGRCPGICQNLISDEEYMGNVKRAEMVFTSRVTEAIHHLESKMKDASDDLDFEQASIWRDRVMALQSCFENDGESNSELVSQGVETSAMLGRDTSASRDIAAVSKCAETGTSIIILFQVRDGKVVNKLAFNVGASKRLVTNTGENTSGDLVMALEQHYLDCRDPLEFPEQLVVAEAIEEEEKATLISYLSERRGKTVQVVTARKKPRFLSSTDVLVDAVQRNAHFESTRASERLRALERDLTDLRDLLKPHFGSAFKSSKVLNLRRIECYDVSHIAGTAAVASRAVFINGSPTQTLYRRYLLQDPRSSLPGAPNDYHSLKEALFERFNPKNSNDVADACPDLIVIDGGKGQLSASLEALTELGIQVPIVSLAKRVEEVFVPNESVAINVNADGMVEMTDGVRLLCRIRDEAHRWAIQAHRRLRGRAVMRSSLDHVPGLGAAKREMLLRHFGGSVETIARASSQSLREVEGIGGALADRIHQYYHDG